MERELTTKEKREVKQLVVNECANYDKEVGCLLMDDVCPMLHICHSHSGLCKYFRNAVLPTNPTLETVFYDGKVKKCKCCGKSFKPIGKKVYCSETCSKKVATKQAKERMRKLREK